ncbi:MAG TPA: serine/threonine-protein kinase [Gemmatimonadales bacterium]|nr:serine/threonine-protein kinase [Gemmatimonadales bacterium]
MKFCPVCGTEYADDVKFCPRDGQTLKSANPSGDLIGQVIADRYHVTKKLGEGGMGAVYLAEHVKMGRKSAIKVMSASMSHDPDAVSRFNREANNASRINHPNICAIYDFGETPDGLIYLAMEFIEGDSLNGILKKSGPMTLQRATPILRQTAEALKVAHDAGIVHRDLKPDNIMIARMGGKDVVKVVDFGIAKAVGGDESGQKVTKTGLVVGTPEYMSPEQLSGDKLDGRSDLYSLALVYYRMITGTLPFQAETSQETMIKRLTDDPMPLRQALPTGNFPPSLQAVMDRALARYPNDRYGDAVEFATDVEQAIAGFAPEGGATMVVGASDLKTMVAGAAAGTAAVPKTRVAGPADVRRGEGAPPAAPKKSPVAAIAAGVAVVVLAGGGYALFGRGHAATPADTTAAPAAQQVAGGDSAPATPPRPQQPQAQPQVQPSSQQTQLQSRPATTAPRPTTTAAHDPVRIGDELDAQLDQIIEGDEATRLRIAARAAEIYDYADLPTGVRAQAAASAGQAYLEVANAALSAGETEKEARNRQLGTDWMRKAARLDPKYQRNLQGPPQ